MVAQQARATVEGHERGFDGFWSSSLVDATLMGKPDTAVVGIDHRLSRLQDVLAVTELPAVFDADNGGTTEEFAMHVKRMEAIGVSAVIVEDKTGPKRNSLAGAQQHQEDPARFAAKLTAARSALRDPDFTLIARIESLILGQSQQHALTRARVYADAGADAIMIHSRQNTAQEVVAFARAFRPLYPEVPLVVVPTTFPAATEDELARAGFDMVIYANHLLRAAYPAMQRTAARILRTGGGLPSEPELLSATERLSDPELLSVDDLLGLIPGNLP